MPTSNGGDFTALTNAYNTPAKLTGSPAYFSYSGRVLDGSLGYVGGQGGYWSATSWGRYADGTLGAYNLEFASGYVNPSNDYGFRRGGYSVRCVARGVSSGGGAVFLRGGVLGGVSG